MKLSSWGINMPFKANLLVLGALLCISVSAPASAQTVYKCGSGRSVTYSEKPCSKRVLDTDQAPIPVKPNPKETDVRRIEQNRILARAMRPRPGESADEFKARRQRARLLATDREECARLDKRMPVEQASMINPDPREVLKAETALGESRKRFSELRC
jgi:hypothetical protein